jgi:hypothetical protein
VKKANRIYRARALILIKKNWMNDVFLKRGQVRVSGQIDLSQGQTGANA